MVIIVQIEDKYRDPGYDVYQEFAAWPVKNTHKSAEILESWRRANRAADRLTDVTLEYRAVRKQRG